MRRRAKRRKETARKNQNIVGPAVHKLRLQKGWTQEQAAAKAQCAGLDFSRQVLVNIETRRRGVNDYKLANLAKLYRCSFDELFPEQYHAAKRSDGKRPLR